MLSRSNWKQKIILRQRDKNKKDNFLIKEIKKTLDCCTASLDRWLRSRSFLSTQTKMTSLTTGHVGALGLRHPASRTGPCDTTGQRQEAKSWVVE